MYGGYGGGMGSYGGYSGLGGTSYGGMGSYGGLGRYDTTGNRSALSTASTVKKEGQGENTEEGGDGTQKQPQQNPDKKVVEQWFKMMGGLRSILELGFAFLALANFCMTTSQLLKKFMEFTKEKSISIAKFLQRKVPTKAITNLMSPERRGKTMKAMAVGLLRLFAAFLLVLGIKMRKDIKEQNKRREEEMMLELQQLKEDGVQMQDEKDIEERELVREKGTDHDANL